MHMLENHVGFSLRISKIYYSKDLSLFKKDSLIKNDSACSFCLLSSPCSTLISDLWVISSAILGSHSTMDLSASSFHVCGFSDLMSAFWLLWMLHKGRDQPGFAFITGVAPKGSVWLAWDDSDTLILIGEGQVGNTCPSAFFFKLVILYWGMSDKQPPTFSLTLSSWSVSLIR